MVNNLKATWFCGCLLSCKIGTGWPKAKIRVKIGRVGGVGGTLLKFGAGKDQAKKA